MKTELVAFKSKSWGIVAMPNHPGHFYTGYDNSWDRGAAFASNQGLGAPKTLMQIGTNAIIDEPFQIKGFSRGRSAANFSGEFKSYPGFSYELGMEGVNDVIAKIQSGEFAIEDGYIVGRWTFAKQGQSFFLRPL